MGLYFQSVISGSSGNCLLLWTGQTTLLIDAGFRAQSSFREMLGDILPEVSGAVISHLHGDHVSYASLRVLEEHGVPVYVHRHDIALLRDKHLQGGSLGGLRLRPFSSRGLFGPSRRIVRIGEFSIKPFEVPHDPSYTTFGFEVRCIQRGKQRKVVIATDLRGWGGLASRFTDADLIYVEANHDLDLLRKFPNYNSRYHLSNPECGSLLRHTLAHSRNRPVAVVLGHLSEERNRPGLAHDTVAEILDRAGHRGIKLHVAPRSEPSRVIRVLG